MSLPRKHRQRRTVEKHTHTHTVTAPFVWLVVFGDFSSAVRRGSYTQTRTHMKGAAVHSSGIMGKWDWNWEEEWSKKKRVEGPRQRFFMLKNWRRRLSRRWWSRDRRRFSCVRSCGISFKRVVIIGLRDSVTDHLNIIKGHLASIIFEICILWDFKKV